MEGQTIPKRHGSCGRTIRQRPCSHQFTVTSGSIFASRKLPIRDYTIALVGSCTVEECHQNAEECLRWASVAKTEEERKSSLDIARTWTEAASMADGGCTNDIPKHLPNFKQR
jgi:hypothetical protein